MTLYFENSRRQERIIAENLIARKDVYKAINDFLDDHHFKSYYSREIYKPAEVTFDVGSHTEFFHLKGTEEEVLNFKNDAH
jgi:hypothetical protein